MDETTPDSPPFGKSDAAVELPPDPLSMSADMRRDTSFDLAVIGDEIRLTVKDDRGLATLVMTMDDAGFLVASISHARNAMLRKLP